MVTLIFYLFCIFQNFPTATFITYHKNVGYIISVGIDGNDSTLTMENSCWVNNDVTGVGMITAFLNSSLSLMNNFAIDNGSNITCSFVAFSETDLQSESDITCLDYDAPQCFVDTTITAFPTASPIVDIIMTAMPVPETTSSSSSSPSTPRFIGMSVMGGVHAAVRRWLWSAPLSFVVATMLSSVLATTYLV
jgi:hypothetical protein